MHYKKLSVFFILPAFFFYSVKVIIPILIGFYYSFFNTDGITRMIFTGLDNYLRIFRDEEFLRSSIVTIKYSIMMVGAGQIISLLLALLLVRATKVNIIIRSVTFVPVIMSMVAVSFIWKIIFSYNGPLNTIMDNLGLEGLKQGWLTDPKVALAGIVVVGVYKGVGIGLILYMNALMTIPNELYESAEIDGAKTIGVFFKITLPLMLPGISISVLTATINNLKDFEKMLILTAGGPIGSTTTLGYYIVERATASLWVGYASAMAIVLFVAIALITYLQNKFFEDRTVQY